MKGGITGGSRIVEVSNSNSRCCRVFTPGSGCNDRMVSAVTSQSVLAQSAGAVRILTLNRPAKLNALNLEMQQQRLAQLRSVAAGNDARVLILTGAGKAFCAGGDHAVRQEAVHGGFQRREEIRRDYLETMRCLMRLPIPVIAAVNGIAAGFGAGLVALCDIVVMGEHAALSDPHVKFDPMRGRPCPSGPFTGRG
jgi:enoyl-CoA hydratase/carnithine racemase